MWVFLRVSRALFRRHTLTYQSVTVLVTIMGEDHRGGVVGQRALYYFTWVYGCAVDGSLEQLLKADHPMPIVQKQASENLVRVAPQARDQEGAGLVRVGKDTASRQLRSQVPAAKLKCRLQLGVFRVAEPREATHALAFGLQQSPQTPIGDQQLPRQIERGFPSNPGAQKNR